MGIRAKLWCTSVCCVKVIIVICAVLTIIHYYQIVFFTRYLAVAYVDYDILVIILHSTCQNDLLTYERSLCTIHTQ